MKNSLENLHDLLFKQLERLGDESLKGENLKEEIDRAKAVSDVASKIISNGSLVLDAAKFKDDKWDADAEVPKMLLGDKND